MFFLTNARPKKKAHLEALVFFLDSLSQTELLSSDLDTLIQIVFQ